MKRTYFSTLENWKTRRQDPKMELHWKKVEEDQGGLNGWQEYQKEWNFRETDYEATPGKIGYNYGDPAFVFETKLVKYLRHKSCLIVDGVLTDIRYED